MVEPPHTDPTATSALTDAEYHALARFRFALRVFLRFSKDAARAAGVTPEQHQLLLAVRGSDSGSPTVSDLAESLQVRHHSAVELIDRAVDADILERLSAVHRDELRRFHTELQPILTELGD
jgi:DNA-binding MarR family transcriptional regulator